jgi:hypothetical protein
VEHHQADVWQAAARGAAGDDAARFLRELRQLRDGAGLGHAELAARAHYPYDLIKAAEAGPSLPDLPVLSAYVRGCGGTAEEWEERWRQLTSTPSLPVSESRHAGNSAAATAGARIGAVTQVVDAPDPSVIIAALNRVAEGMAVGGPDLDAALTVPPRPAYPSDDLPGSGSTAGFPAADALAPDVALPEVAVPEVSLPLTPVEDPVATPADFTPFAPVAPVEDPVPTLADFTPFAPVAPVDDPVVIPADARAAGSLSDPMADPMPAAAEPAADVRPKGWDPIRVSAAWPKIGDEDPRKTLGSADGAGPSDSSKAGKSPAGAARAGAASGNVAKPVVRQSAWAGSVDASGEPAGVARPGSRARTLMVAVVLICVVAVVLAIFA